MSIKLFFERVSELKKEMVGEINAMHSLNYIDDDTYDKLWDLMVEIGKVLEGRSDDE